MRFEAEGDLKLQLDQLLNQGLNLFDNFELPVELGIETEFNRVAYSWPSADASGVLKSNGSGSLSWVAASAPGDHAIDSAVHTLSGATAGHVLRASAADAFAIAELQFSDLGGSIANAQVPESAVTQHEAALTILSSQVDMAVIDTPAFTTVQHLQDVFHSSGWISGGVLSNDGSANIDVTAGEGLIRAADVRTNQLLFNDWAASTTNAISDGTAKFVGVEYNAGSPQIVLKATDTWDFNTDFPVGSVVREGSTLHISQAEHAIGDHANFMIQRLYEVQKFARDNITGGLILSEDGASRFVTVSTGVIWSRLNKFTISAIDTDTGGAADTFETYKHVSGTFTLTTGVTTWPNTHYDDGTDLVLMDSNKYANLWFYLDSDGDLVMLYGTAQYNKSTLAELESPPSTIPLRVSTHSFLIGRMIFKKSASAAVEINSVFDTVFSPTLVSDHGNLGGLSDDDHTQYSLADGTRAFTGNVTFDADALIGGGTDHGARLGVNFGASDDIATFESTDVTANVYIVDSVGSVGVRCSSGALHLLSGGDAGAITGTAAALILATNQVATFAGAVNMGALVCTTINMQNQALSNVGTITMTAGVSKIVPGATSWGVRNTADSADNIIITDVGVVTFRGNTLIGTTTAATGSPRLDVLYGTRPVIGISDTRTDATIKESSIGAGHYTNAEEMITIMGVTSTSGSSILSFGGGFSTLNTATKVEFYTAADNTTTTGTLAADITGVGTASILRLRGDITIDKDLNHDGDKAGFFTTAPVSKPTGVAVTDVGIHAALVTLGLIAGP